MMRHLFRLFALLFTVMIAIAAAPASATRTNTQFEGEYRTYEMIGRNASRQGMRPLLVVLHPPKSNIRVARRFGLEDMAVRAGWIVVYPQALDGVWQDGRDTPSTQPSTERNGNDDVRFIVELVNRLGRQRVIDPDRVMIAGFSNGGMMAQRLACQMPGRVLAVASVNGLYPQSLQCVPSHPVDVLLMQGTDDKYMPFEGGKVGYGRQKGYHGSVRSAMTTAAMWRVANACPYDAKQSIDMLDKLDRADMSEVRLHSWKDCPVYLYEILGGGHQWPGRPVTTSNASMRLLLSPATRQIRAEQTVINFFKQALRRKASTDAMANKAPPPNVEIITGETAATDLKAQRPSVRVDAATTREITSQGVQNVRTPAPANADNGAISISNEAAPAAALRPRPVPQQPAGNGPRDLLAAPAAQPVTPVVAAPMQVTVPPGTPSDAVSVPVQVQRPTTGVKRSQPTKEALARMRARGGVPGVRIEPKPRTNPVAPNQGGVTVTRSDSGMVKVVDPDKVEAVNTLLGEPVDLLGNQGGDGALTPNDKANPALGAGGR
ncbi:MAG: hypothetical protein Alpg2KO_03390 [Alphaproteobacteria bacterium]